MGAAAELLQHGANPNFNKWWSAPICQAKSAAMTNLLFRYGVDKAMAHGAVGPAIIDNLEDKVLALLDNGVSPNQCADNFIAPLVSVIFCSKPSPKMAWILLARGAHPDKGVETELGETSPLHLCIRALKGANLKPEQAPLYTEIATILLDHQADPNKTNGIGQTPLIALAEWDAATPEMAQMKERLVQVLIGHNADVRRAWKGKSVWDCYKGTDCAKHIRNRLNELNKKQPIRSFLRHCFGARPRN